MAADWQKLCHAGGIRVVGDRVKIPVGKLRHHEVAVRCDDGGFLASATVLGPSDVNAIPDLALSVWMRNREARLVGFRIDGRSRLMAEAWIPEAGLTASEFQLYLRNVAEEADRFEYALTGKDRY